LICLIEGGREDEMREEEAMEGYVRSGMKRCCYSWIKINKARNGEREARLNMLYGLMGEPEYGGRRNQVWGPTGAMEGEDSARPLAARGAERAGEARGWSRA
jgi:hypothetical protein